eukprot:6481665-Amphidinium_carterae.3
MLEIRHEEESARTTAYFTTLPLPWAAHQSWRWRGGRGAHGHAGHAAGCSRDTRALAAGSWTTSTRTPWQGAPGLDERRSRRGPWELCQRPGGFLWWEPSP